MKSYAIVGHFTRSDPSGHSFDVRTSAGERLTVTLATKADPTPIDASGGLQKLIVSENDTVSLNTTAQELWERTKRDEIGILTIYKYYDDSGCVSKTRDDGYALEV